MVCKVKQESIEGCKYADRNRPPVVAYAGSAGYLSDEITFMCPTEERNSVTSLIATGFVKCLSKPASFDGRSNAGGNSDELIKKPIGRKS
jgi:hypothetical protein